ncbi:MAG: hypothetical protein CSA89_00765 [Bacteroidales bacterium]|nr:MAG: hypothetical protein CSA89_00765 [Bacteroidales bacterium]
MEIKAHIRIEDMHLGGVSKLPNGGVVATLSRNLKTNNWLNQMCIIGKDCDLKQKINVCPSPVSPNVCGNIICVGSSAIEEGLKYKFQIYDADNYQLLKKYQFRRMLSAWKYRMYDDEVYLPIEPEKIYQQECENSYIVKVNSTTGDTTSIRFGKNIAYDDAFDVFKKENILYICSLLQKKIIKYDIESKTILAETTITDFPEISALPKFDNVRSPIVKNGYVYAFFGGGYDIDTQKEKLGWVKLSEEDLSLVDMKVIDKYRGGFLGDECRYVGNYFMVRAIFQNTTNLMLIDYTTGEIAKYIQLKR